MDKCERLLASISTRIRGLSYDELMAVEELTLRLLRGDETDIERELKTCLNDKSGNHDEYEAGWNAALHLAIAIVASGVEPEPLPPPPGERFDTSDVEVAP